MKIIFILLAFLCITKSYAQDPDLFRTWYLQKIILEDGTEHIPIPNEEVPYIDLIFIDNPIHEFETAVCNVYFGTLEFDSNPYFTIQDAAMTVVDCDLPINSNFEGIYFSLFLDSNNNHLEDPFLYEIITTGDEKTLIITNVRGDIAYYGDTYLSITDFETLKVALYPNPVSDKLVIESQENIKQITIYDVQGKQLRSSYLNNSERVELDVSILQNGVYFIEIKAFNGNSVIRKVIKQ